MLFCWCFRNDVIFVWVLFELDMLLFSLFVFIRSLFLFRCCCCLFVWLFVAWLVGWLVLVIVVPAAANIHSDGGWEYQVVVVVGCSCCCLSIYLIVGGC